DGVEGLLDREAALLQRALVGVSGDYYRLAPDDDAAAERQRQVEAVPALEDATTARGISRGKHRRARQACNRGYAGLGAHCRAVRPVGGDADASAGLQAAEDLAHRAAAAVARGAGDPF